MRIAIFTDVFLPKVDGITNRLLRTIRHLVKRGRCSSSHPLLDRLPEARLAIVGDGPARAGSLSGAREHVASSAADQVEPESSEGPLL